MKILFLLTIAFFRISQAYPQKTILIKIDSISKLKAEATPFQAKNANPFALVAGGSKGIGFGIAEALALRQYNLILIARHHTPLLEAKRELEARNNPYTKFLNGA
jgi:hypothetical protein